jgi:hypothetical protein
MAQALEFRSAAQSATLLTKPLLMYYSFLNLLRGVMAVDDDLALTKGHGLKYHSGPSLFDNAAVVNTGTFAEYLRACSVVAPSNFRLSLAACLAHIPELAGEVVSVGLKSQVAPVAVDALRSGHVSLCFNQAFISESEFRAGWDPNLTGLQPDSLLADEGTVLLRRTPVEGDQQQKCQSLCDMCVANFLPDVPVIRRTHLVCALGTNGQHQTPERCVLPSGPIHPVEPGSV